MTVQRPLPEVQAAIAAGLAQAGFAAARDEAGYLEAHRGTAKPFRIVSRMPTEDTPVVVCVSITDNDAAGRGTQITVGAYPDLGPGMLLGPISRRKWHTALAEAVRIVVDTAALPRVAQSG